MFFGTTKQGGSAAGAGIGSRPQGASGQDIASWLNAAERLQQLNMAAGKARSPALFLIINCAQDPGPLPLCWTSLLAGDV